MSYHTFVKGEKILFAFPKQPRFVRFESGETLEIFFSGVGDKEGSLDFQYAGLHLDIPASFANIAWHANQAYKEFRFMFPNKLRVDYQWVLTYYTIHAMEDGLPFTIDNLSLFLHCFQAAMVFRR